MTEAKLEAGEAATLATASELRQLIGKLRRKLSEQATPGDFTPSQISVLTRLLQDGPTTLTALARAEGMRPQSMSAIVAALDAVGYVSGSPDPTDGRQTILSLTELATTTINANRVAKDDWLFHAIRERYDQREQAELVRAVELLRRLLEP
ncbi:MAG TPA: MarR family transcriptional regulator [Galbitalea sp.]|jgi:DNA-binding MarR family transcriptional regulator